MRRRLCRGVIAVAALLAAGCGSSAATLNAAGLGLPMATAPGALATTTIYTSPDGGIYKNPDRVEVVMARRGGVAPVAALLGGAASGWSALQRFGDFTVVVLRLRDDGKVGSDPQLNDLQVASDYAPAGTASGPLRHYYHPTYPLALVAAVKPGDSCSIHLDPGRTVVAILVYPPINLPSVMVWGAYGDFALSVPTGGAVPLLDGALSAVACSSPSVAGPSPAP